MPTAVALCVSEWVAPTVSFRRAAIVPMSDCVIYAWNAGAWLKHGPSDITIPEGKNRLNPTANKSWCMKLY
jgi:hypothetical protein